VRYSKGGAQPFREASMQLCMSAGCMLCHQALLCYLPPRLGKHVWWGGRDAWGVVGGMQSATCFSPEAGSSARLLG
jgi:hypothetical protein